MNTVKITRTAGLCAVAALVTTAFTYTPASAAPALPGVPVSLVATSQDGAGFELADYAANDITVQVVDSAKADVDVDDSQDLSYSWSVTPFAAGASPVDVPATGTDEQATDVNGKFIVPLPIAQGAGTYTLTAELGAGTAGGTAITLAPFTVKTGNAAPTGSTATITPLGTATPGQAQGGTLTVKTGNVPVAGQVFSLTVDHGFFTNSRNAPAAGTLVGDLDNLGTKLTGVTDTDGTIDFEVGIARDAGFDDDGLVTATVKAVSGPTAEKSATWSSGTELNPPLNGRVAITAAPASEQENPVNPALAGNKTLFDVFALDQFGNRVGDVPIELTYGGYLKDFDYSDDDTVSDFDTFGDIWVISNVAGSIDVTGTWEDAPTSVYDAQGTAVTGITDATGSATASTYEVNFNASSFSISSSVADTVRVGTAVTQTVRVIDQQGNPVNGYQVRFLRYGPDDISGDVVSTKTTNALGVATYSFVGKTRGRATITAEVSDGNRRRELTSTAAFGTIVKARLAKDKKKSRSSADRLAVTATPLAAGAKVQLYRVVKGKQLQVGSKTLNRKGEVVFKIRDRNRNAKTTYVAVVRSTSKSVADQSNTVKTR